MMTAGRAAFAPATLLGRPLAPLIDWATGVLAGRGIEITGTPTEMRRRAWSIQVRVPTTAGTMWLKASADGFAHEGPLVQLLSRLRPGSVLEPLEIDQERGWLLSPDGGPVGDDTAATWTTLLRGYAELQQSLTGHIDELRATGTPYLPPTDLVTVYRDFEYRVPGLGDRISETASALAEFDRLTIEHNDLHPRHLFTASGTIFDWGDAVITHPFLNRRTVSGALRERYLDHWRRKGPIHATELALADKLGPLVALNPWRTVDISAPQLDCYVEGLLTALRAGFR